MNIHKQFVQGTCQKQIILSYFPFEKVKEILKRFFFQQYTRNLSTHSIWLWKHYRGNVVNYMTCN